MKRNFNFKYIDSKNLDRYIQIIYEIEKIENLKYSLDKSNHNEFNWIIWIITGSKFDEIT
jgi:hypothetical protein